MTASGSRRPPAPTCEDCWEDEAQLSSSDSRAPANVAIKRTKSTESDIKSFAGKKSHDGSDSGYSSKAGTSDTMSTSSKKKGADLKVNTKNIERERAPYGFTPNRSDQVRMSPSKPKEVRIENPKVPARFQHAFGICWVCDQYGYHFDIAKEISRPATTAPPETAKHVRVPSKPMAKEESDIRPSAPRRSSSKRDSRPMSMFIQQSPYPFPQAVAYTHPEMVTQGWQNQPMQMPQYPQYNYAYGQPSPMSSSFNDPSFLEMQYGQRPGKMFDGDLDDDEDDRPRRKQASREKDLQRLMSRESRSRSRTLKMSDSAEADRIAMPPPPRPDTARPTIKKLATENPVRRRSIYIDDEDERPDIRALMAARERRTSQSKPPSAYKTRTSGEVERPRARKSSSYSNAQEIVQVAASPREMPRRRTDPLEQRQAEIEAYLSKTQKGAINPLLTAEALKRFDQKHSNTPSEAGSTRSKHSSKESASGRVRAGTSVTSAPRTNITMDSGISFSIPADYGDQPLDIQIGNLRLSMNSGKEEERSRDLKRIERAPSDVSQASRRSLTSGSAQSAPKTKEEAQALAREAYRSKANANSSKKSSRTTSRNRADTGRRVTSAEDYSRLDESYYYGFGA